MTHLLYKPWALLCLLTLVTACGGSDGEDPVVPPVANISTSSTTLNAGEEVILDGVGSSTTNGTGLTYAWSLTAQPANSLASLTDTTSVTTRFIPDLPGQYSIRLIVTDDKASSSPATVTLTVTNPDPIAILEPQISGLTGGQVWLDGSSSLPPAGGDASLLQYSWTLTTQPPGSSVTLQDADTVWPRFTPQVEGIYVVELVVSYEVDGELKSSDPVTQRILANQQNAVPVARIVAPATATLGERISLDGSTSYDADTPFDNSNLQYTWYFGYYTSTSNVTGPMLSKPPGSAVVWDEAHQGYTPEFANTVQPSFVPDKIGEYQITLQVFDGTAHSSYVTHKILVDTLPESHANQKPVAVINAAYPTYTNELELNDSINVYGSGSWDLEYASGLSWNSGSCKEWILTSAPDGFDRETVNTGWAELLQVCQDGTATSNANDAASFTPTLAGDYTIQLRVSDPADTELWSDTVSRTFTALRGANRWPSAHASTTQGTQNTIVGSYVTLSGSGSSDADDNALTYLWQLLALPVGSQASLTNAMQENVDFTPDVEGNYYFHLTVTDSHGASYTTQAAYVILAKAQNTAPAARPVQVTRYSAKQPFVIYPSDQLLRPTIISNANFGLPNPHLTFVADAYDPDNDTLSYVWNLTQEPGGIGSTEMLFVSYNTTASVNPAKNGTSNLYSCRNGLTLGISSTLENFFDVLLPMRTWTCNYILLSPTVPGDYSVNLLVTDGVDNLGPYNFSFTAVERANHPNLLLEAFYARTQEWYSNLAGFLTFRPQPFPYSATVMGGLSNSGYVFNTAQANSELAYGDFQLTAFDKDYTITNVQMNWAQTLYSDYDLYIALTDADGVVTGTVLRPGDQLVIPRGTTQRFKPTLKLSERPSASADRPALRDFEFSFNIAEDPDYTFYLKVGL